MLHKMNRFSLLFSFICFAISLAGCGGGGPAIIPSSELTEEQKAAIKAADEAVDDEESQGKNPANKKKK
jgi:predicted small lipoprotein YifL